MCVHVGHGGAARPRLQRACRERWGLQHVLGLSVSGATVRCAQNDERWTPATIFVVTDHLHSLLVGNLFRRDQRPGARPARCPCSARPRPAGALAPQILALTAARAHHPPAVPPPDLGARSTRGLKSLPGGVGLRGALVPVHAVNTGECSKQGAGRADEVEN